MDNIFILVIDAAPESPEAINSLLRNSGINVHVLHADSSAEAERQIREFKPALVVCEPGSGESVTVRRIVEMSRLHGVLPAVRFSPGKPGVIQQAVAESACIALNVEENDHLVELVRQLAGMGTAARGLSAVREQNSELQQRYELLLESTSEAVAYLHEGLHVFANPAYLDLLEARSFSDLESQSLLEIIRNQDIDIKSLVRDFSSGTFPREPLPFTVVTPGGNEFQARVTFSPVQFHNEACVQMVVRREGARSGIQEELNRFRSLDPLTGLMQRGEFMKLLDQRIEGMPDHAAPALFFLAPDGKDVESTELRVRELDEFILGISQRVQRHLETDDLVCRFGDQAFAFFALRGEKAQLKDLAERIRADIEARGREQARADLPATASIGIAMLGMHTGTAEEAMHQAREAARQAGQTGNCTEPYRPARETVTDSDAEAQWTQRLKYALNNDDFYSVQRTIINLEGDNEGLFDNHTYLHEGDHDVPYAEFMPPAERQDLASTIDRQVIPGLLRAISGTGDRHFINISGNSVHDFSFPSWLQRQMREFDVQGSQLILQLSTQSANLNSRAARRLIEEMQPQGCSFSLSGFHDQRPCLELLDRLDVSFLQLADGLSDDLKASPEHQASIRNVVAAANRRDVQVFVDDVRDSADMATLWQCGVKLVSGDFLQESPKVIGQ